ncbi:unnamed protein product [Notodromas monacha]|uniref:Metalloendopeptidase n=1 Tax=Notodromas monacha TaxID=399045 RepID=A0A7R9GGS3_9CRUS|nr:unnamed protein product [Notodromas monacha]CAG0920726.1 unnamed protein product [Notodromas monacha]
MSVGGQEAASIFKVLDRIKGVSCLTFVKRSNEVKFLWFIKPKEKGSCGSTFGYDPRPGKPTMIYLGKKRCFKQGVLLHEVLHGLGFGHEHARHDRDNFIKIIWSNVPEGKRLQFKKLPAKLYPVHGPYDFYSIMHYPLWPRSRQKVKGNQSIEPITQNKHSLIKHKIGQRIDLTTNDIEKIRVAYGCNKAKMNTKSTTVTRATSSATSTESSTFGKLESKSMSMSTNSTTQEYTRESIPINSTTTTEIPESIASENQNDATPAAM